MRPSGAFAGTQRTLSRTRPSLAAWRYTEAMPSSQALANTLAGIVGAGNVLSDADLKATYETDWTRRYTGAARLVVRPRSTEELAATLALLAEGEAAVFDNFQLVDFSCSLKYIFLSLSKKV